MAVFRYRLETKLKLSEKMLEERQKELAEEQLKLQQVLEERNNQQRCLIDAMAGQRQACILNPLTLGMWQNYVRDQLDCLREKEKQLELQQQALNQARQRVLEAHQETEKFQRLKQKRYHQFIVEEQRKEQAQIDEVAQRRYAELN